MLMFNIVGLGLGPLFAGVVSDSLKDAHGVDSLRWALMALIRWSGTPAIFLQVMNVWRKTCGYASMPMSVVRSRMML